MSTSLSPWEVKEGSFYRSSITERVYRVTRIEAPTEMAILDSVDGLTSVITDIENLGLFYLPSDGNIPEIARM